MNKSVIKYKLYQTLLESDLTSEQKTALLEASFLQKVADFFGAGTDVLTKDLKALFANNKLARRAATAKKNIAKEIDELKSIAKDAGVSDEAVYDMLNLTLKDKGVSPAEVASPPKAEQSGGTSGDSSGGVKPGKPIESTPEAVPTLAKAAGEAAGQDPEKAAEQAAEKKVDAPKATEVLAKAISGVSKVDAGKVSKILGFLIKNNHMVAEGRRIMSVDIKKAIVEITRRQNDKIMLERWNSMSGIKQILNEDVDEGKKKKFEDVLEDIRKAFKPEELSDDDILNVVIALDDLDSIQIK